MRAKGKRNPLPHIGLLALTAASLLVALAAIQAWAGQAPPSTTQTGRLAVTVQSSGGNAVPGATVTIRSTTADTKATASVALEQTKRTLPDGTISFSSLAPQRYTITVTAQDNTTGQGEAIVTAGGTATVTIKLGSALPSGPITPLPSTTQTGRLAVTVLSSGGNAVPGATVTIRSTTADTKATASVALEQTKRTLPDGTISFSSLAPQRYTITVTAPNKKSAQGSAAVKAGGTTAVSINVALAAPPTKGPLSPSTTQTGRLAVTVQSSDGKAVTGAEVALKFRVTDETKAKTSGTRPTPQTTNAEGRATFAELAPGTYTIHATAKNGQSARGTASVTAGGTATVTIPMAEHR